MQSQEKQFARLMRVRYQDKLFDIFSGKDHKKTFLEVRLENGREEYYYPILKDYIELNNIYNKPFDGILHSKKYSFKQKVIFATSATGLSLLLSPILAESYTNYKIEPQSKKYEMGKSEIDLQEISEPNTLPKAIFIDSEDYYRDGSTVMVYNNDILSYFGFNPVTFEEVRETLQDNTNLSSKYMEYESEFLNQLERKIPNVDLRVHNNNLKTLTIVEDNDTFYEYETNTMHIKKYENEQQEKIDFFHELVHTLNYGKLLVSEENYDGVKELHKFFQRTNYGGSLSEGFTTILTDYLLTEDTNAYFQKENHDFSAYQEITPYCYQILKTINIYALYDFINYDIVKFSEELKIYELEDSIAILDAYNETISSQEEIEIISPFGLEELETTLLELRIRQEIERGTSTFEILCMMNEIPFYIENRADIVQNCFKAYKDKNIELIFDDGLENSDDIITKGIPTIKVYGENEKELLDLNSRMIIVYRVNQDHEIKYRIGYYGKDQQYHDCETNQIVHLNEKDQLELSSLIPQLNMIMRVEITDDTQFKLEIEQKFQEQDEVLEKIEKEMNQKQQTKEQMKDELVPLIEGALIEGKGDLEICRMITTNVETVNTAMEILSEISNDCLIQYRSPTEYTNHTPIISVIRGDGSVKSETLGESQVIYLNQDELGINYRLGKIKKSESEIILYDYLEDKLVEPSEYNEIVKLSEIIPESSEYSLVIKEEFFASEEFLKLMDNQNIKNSK